MKRVKIVSFRKVERQGRGFTLIELLIVIAIVAILAGILFPVLAQSRDKGRQAVCWSHLRQLALANRMYASDWDGYFVPAAPRFLSDCCRWFGVRNAQGRFEPRSGALVPYLKEGGQIRICPSFHASSGFDAGTGGYVYNYVGVGSRVWYQGYTADLAAFDGSLSEAEISEPSETVMFADGALDTGTHLVEYAFLIAPAFVLARIPNAYYPLDPSVHFRHQQTASVAFVDGHSQPLKMAASVESSGAYPGANPRRNAIGWFAPLEGDTFYDPE